MHFHTSRIHILLFRLICLKSEVIKSVVPFKNNDDLFSCQLVKEIRLAVFTFFFKKKKKIIKNFLFK